MDVLRRRAVATPERPALVDAGDGHTWRYSDLDRLVTHAAERLERQAAGTDRVGTLCRPSPAFVVAFHAAQRLGWTVVGLDTRLGGSALDTRLDRAGVDLLVHGPETPPPDSTDRPTIPAATLLADTGGETPLDTTPGPRPGPPAVSADLGDQPTETSVVLFTSGTTGEPKAVRLTAQNLRASAVASAFRLGVAPGDRWLCCLPVAHMGGLAPVVRAALYGTTLVVQRSFDARETGRVLAAHDVTGVSLVPTQLRRLLDTGAPLAALSTVLVGGAPVSGQLLDRALSAGVSVFSSYGLTEAASQVATARPETARDHPGTVGQPLYGLELTVVADGEPADPGERGELVVAGPAVTPGYLDESATEAATGAWGLHTGDIGYRDDAGRLWVVGRRDELVLTGGELVVPVTVAESIRDHPAVADAAVVGLDDPEWGERLAALVVPDGDLDTATVEAHCRETLPGFKRPKVVSLGTSVPRTASGTVDREAVRERLRENRS